MASRTVDGIVMGLNDSREVENEIDSKEKFFGNDLNCDYDDGEI